MENKSIVEQPENIALEDSELKEAVGGGGVAPINPVQEWSGSVCPYCGKYFLELHKHIPVCPTKNDPTYQPL